MKIKQLTILKICSLLLLIGSSAFTFVNWKTLSESEGWGIIAMVPLFLFGIIGYGIDFILTKLIKNKLSLNLIEVVIVLFFLMENMDNIINMF